MSDMISFLAIGIFLGVAIAVGVAAGKIENSLTPEQEVLRQLRNEVQEMNLRMDKTIHCFRDLSSENPQNDCSVRFNFEDEN